MAPTKQRARKTVTRARPVAKAKRPVAPTKRTTRPVVPATTRSAPVTAAPLLTGLPAGLGAGTLAADVSGQLRAVAPTFGQVLQSIGTGVADSQTALDKGVIDTVQALADTKITVVTDVIQHLNDDGEPVPADTQLVSTDLSVLNFFMPTVHEWKHVVLSMDLSVGAFDESDGVNFNAHQSGGGVGGVGLFWGFVGLGYEYDYDNKQSSSRQHEQEASWSSGEVRLDATLGPRQTGKFPIPAQIAIGPQIVFAQGTVKDTPVAGAGVNRSIDAVITVLKAAGDPNPNKGITVDAGNLRISFASTGGFSGNQTNSDGQVKVTITRNIPNSGTGPIKVPVIVRLGALSQTFNLTI